MKRIILLALVCSIGSVTVIAQKKIRGRVFDSSNNNPLAGATISFAGKGGTTTDKDGMFTVDCDKTNRITVSFVGYETWQQVIKNCDEELRIALVPSGRLLDEVEITAISNQNKSLLYQPSSITKLSTKELKRGTGLFLDDAINGNVPGVTMNRRAVSSGQQFNIRGYGNGSRGTRGISSNFDGQGYKVYLNGIPVTDAEGITLLDDIDFGSVGNVEVVKGPAGSLYGLAIAGVVNLETIRPEKGKTSIGQDVLIGNYGLQRYTTHFQMGGEHSSLLVNYGHQQSDGFTVHNASHKDFVNIAGDFQPNAKQSVTAYLGYSNSYDERSGELTVAQYNANDYSGNIEYIRRNGHSEVISIRAGLGHTYMFNSHISNTTTVFATGLNSNASSAGGWTDKDPVNFGLRSAFNTKFSLKNDVTLSGITGIETQHQNAQTVGYTMVKDPADPATTWTLGVNPYWIIGASNSNIFTTTGTTSLFTEWTLALPHDLSFTGGIGLSTMKVRLDDRFYNAATPLKTRRYDTAYKNMFSPHLAINKVFSKQFSLYAAYSRGYKAPVSSYFFLPFNATYPSQSGIVNKNLRPEIGDQFEIGTKGALLNGRLTYNVALFDAIFSHKMTTVAVPFNAITTLYSYVTNGGKQKDKGIEVLVKYTAYKSDNGFFKTITPFANLAYSDFTYGDNYKFHIIVGTTKDSIVDYSNKKVAGVAKVLGNIGVDLGMAAGLYANINYLYKDGFPITSDGLLKSSSYSLINAKLGIQRSLSKHFDINAFFGVNNIAGTKYPIMVFVNQIPDAYIAAPAKANYYGGVNLKFNF
jgi:iron complex outermembrane recepter protein